MQTWLQNITHSIWASWHLDYLDMLEQKKCTGFCFQATVTNLDEMILFPGVMFLPFRISTNTSKFVTILMSSSNICSFKKIVPGFFQDFFLKRHLKSNQQKHGLYPKYFILYMPLIRCCIDADPINKLITHEVFDQCCNGSVNNCLVVCQCYNDSWSYLSSGVSMLQWLLILPV